jgi:putative solute:sodium symporter small subunit
LREGQEAIRAELAPRSRAREDRRLHRSTKRRGGGRSTVFGSVGVTNPLGGKAMNAEQREAYWRRNLLYIAVLLSIWAAVSYGASILLADVLDRVVIEGFPLGFWFANQGSILTFVVLIFVYVKLMNSLDRKFGVYER